MAKAKINQNFLEILAPKKDFNVLGATVTARALEADDIAELMEMFGDWGSLDIADLYNTQKMETLVAAIYFGTRRDTLEMDSMETAKKVVNMRTLNAWIPVFTFVTGVQFRSVEDDNAPPEAETQQDTQPKNE